MKNEEEKEYNGWRNYETWNCALYLDNDEPTYRFAKTCKSYREFVTKGRRRGYIGVKTPDGINWNSRKLDRAALDAAIKDLNT